jgi:transposase
MRAKEQEDRRREGYRLLRDGQSQATVARALGVSRETVSRWAERMATGGRKSWRSVGQRGPKARLGAAERAELRRLLKAGVVVAGYPNALWTLPRVAEVIKRQWGVELGATQVWRILREQLGWSCQRPERRARERSAAKVARGSGTYGRHCVRKPLQRSGLSCLSTRAD